MRSAPPSSTAPSSSRTAETRRRTRRREEDNAEEAKRSAARTIPSDEPDGVPSDEPDGVPSDAVVLWRVFPREDAAGLRERLGDAPGPSRYLASGELARLAEPTEPGAAAFAPWRVPLRRGEMVLVPAGCPAQMQTRLESCVTVSLDFTAPESADASLEAFSAARDAGGEAPSPREPRSYTPRAPPSTRSTNARGNGRRKKTRRE